MEDVRYINIYDKNIPVRKYGCKNYKKDKPLYFDKPFINLFIQVTNNCNADCDFCIYKNDKKNDFDLIKLKQIIKYLSFNENFNIGKLNFTGGEPCLNFSLFEEIINICKENINVKNKPEVTLNTNGLNLLKILKYEYFLDSIGLSHHHYDDCKNYEIFGSKNIANNELIKEFCNELNNRKILQLRCNLIKCYIDNYSEMTNYMSKMMNIGVKDFGFVTLAPNNNFCKEHQIDFKNLIKINKDLIQVNKWNRVDDNDFNKEYCECANYVYSDESGNICKFYSRLFCRNDLIEGILVYDGKYLRYGFGGEIII